jgi:Arc/MetJ-type ribon-helix-helix transcriptional regulator
MRTLVDIPEDKIAALDALARRKSWSRAEAVRQGIDRLLAEDQAADMAALNEAFGSWKHLGIDGLAYQRALRAEWDERPNAELPDPA